MLISCIKIQDTIVISNAIFLLWTCPKYYGYGYPRVLGARVGTCTKSLPFPALDPMSFLS